MNSESLIEEGKEIISDLVEILNQLSDDDVVQLLGTGSLNDLLKAILDPSLESQYPNLNEFLLANKGRAAILALLRYAITNNYSFRGIDKDGRKSFISPSHIQWFDDGVIFMQGNARFEGLVGLYRKGGKLSYAILARDAKAGETLGPEYFEFVDQEDFSERMKQVQPKKISNLEEPVQKLEILLKAYNNNESEYQELLIQYPWVLGATYKEIHRHTNLDDKNIPDFTGARIFGGHRDILEIKPPFTKMFRDNGTLNANFHDAWTQAERYLDFARLERDYLQRKGFLFDNPRCYLILGYDLKDNEVDLIRAKERMNPSISLLTYNDLLVFMKWTAKFIQDLNANTKTLKDSG